MLKRPGRLAIRPAARSAGALAAGAAAALAFPPFGLLIGLAGYPALLLLIHDEDAPRPIAAAFALGWLAGFAYFLIGCWWVAEAFFVDRSQAWMAPFAALLLPAVLGLFWGGACAAVRALRVGPWLQPAAFAAVFGLFEWLRGHVLTGFPWNLPGETWRAGSAVSQGAAWLGAYGMTTLTVLAAAAFAPILRRVSWRRRLAWPLTGLVLLGLGWGVGAWRLAQADRRPADPDSPVIRLVQPYAPQQTDWTESQLRTLLNRYARLTSQAAPRRPDVVVWPEGALPVSAEDMLAPDGWIGRAMAAGLQPGQLLMVGASRSGSPDAHGAPRWHNSLLIVKRSSDSGLIPVGLYDKHHLVPFGEYMPLEPLAAAVGFKQMVGVGDGFSPGPPPRPLTLGVGPASPVQPLICYEALFPGLARRPAGSRPRWMVNISDDAWFGRTSGPLQHLNLAAYRAIEAGLPMARVTPTGVSAMIDAQGRVVSGTRIAMGQARAVDAILPVQAAPTFYSRAGDLVFWILSLLGVAAAATNCKLHHRLLAHVLRVRNPSLPERPL